jgi:hypothetical protein
MFNAALPPALGVKEYKGQVYTMWPHPNHPSLASLFRRCDELHREDPTRAPTIFFIKEGDHEAGGSLIIKYALKIVGAGRDKTFIRGGGFAILGTKEEGKEVTMSGMTVRDTQHATGIFGVDGLSFLCKDMTFTQCGSSGVYAEDTKARLINCVITQCGWSGIDCGKNALIELEGDQTKVDGNVTSVFSFIAGFYGLQTFDTSSIIHLLFPLTKESVSTNNQGGRNYGNYSSESTGIIQTVNTFEEALP